jgi:hypothetical protein
VLHFGLCFLGNNVINQKYSIRRLFTFFSSLILFFALLFALFFKVAHAGAAEDRSQSIKNAATSSRYSSATGHNYTVGGVRAANDGISADISQRVTVDGSSATVKQKVHIPANDPFYKNAGKYAGKLFRGGLAGAALGVAVDAAVDGAGWVIDEGGKVQKPNPEYQNPTTVQPYHQYRWSGYAGSNLIYVASSAAFLDAYKKANPTYTYISTLQCSSPSPDCIRYSFKTPSGGSITPVVIREANPSYKPSAINPISPTVSVSDAELDDAFTNWFKNNPGSVTDPVRTYIYSPKDKQGNAIPNSVIGTEPSFGQQEITDEMMQNYIANRDAALVKGNTAVIEDSASTSTETNPDGSKTETSTETNPDGTKTKTETKTEVKTNPDTGEVVTTTTTTTTKPDGSTSVKTETSTQTDVVLGF